LPALCRVGSLVGMALWGSQIYAGSKTEWPMFWLYIAFGMGNVALGVTGVWISEFYSVHLCAVVFIAASLLLPETLGRDLSAKGFKTAVVATDAASPSRT
jgi:hypothetical protein